MLDGLLNLSLWGYTGAALVLTHVTIVAVTVYLHRHQAHRALELHPVISHFFRFWLWLTTGMKTREWVAIHRKHHAKCETEEDPHSPQVLGLNKVLWQGAELYRKEATNSATLEKYGSGTPDDWMERRVYSRFPFLGIVLMFLLDLVLFGIAGITVWAVQMVWIPFWAAGVINGIGHYRGYRNYECRDAATNIIPWGIIVGGEELHNNHHTYASSARLSSKWWEFDIGWMYIRSLELVGLARVKRVAPRPVTDPVKVTIDKDTLQAVVRNRFQVMARYCKEVLSPVVKEELRRANMPGKKLIRRSQKILVREDALLSETARRQRESVLGYSENIHLTYQFKRQLESIWNSGNSEHSLEALRQWCKDAEAAGIQALRDFARQIRGYTVQPVG